MIRFVFCSIVLFLSWPGFCLKKNTFSLNEDIKAPLVSLLDSAVYLHKAVYSRKEAQIHLALLKINNQIAELEQSPMLLPYHQHSYIYKVLQDLKTNLEAVKNSKQRRKANVNSINRALTYMAHVYGVKKYAVFFCPQDRSVWMQESRSGKKKRPMHLERQPCGAQVGD